MLTSTPKRRRSNSYSGKVHKKAKKGDYQKGRELARTPKQEIKSFDLANVNVTFGAAGTFTLLNVPVNGAELYQRVGRKIYMKSLHIRGQVFPNGNGGIDFGRLIVFYDSQPNAAASNIGTLLQDSNAAAGTSVTSEINLNNRQRFKILRDMQFMLPNYASADTPNILGYQDQIMQTFNINEFIKLKGLETIFNGANGGTIADITSGSLYICTYSNNANWSFNFGSRLRYYD